MKYIGSYAIIMLCATTCIYCDYKLRSSDNGTEIPAHIELLVRNMDAGHDLSDREIDNLFTWIENNEDAFNEWSSENKPNK